MTMEGPVKLVLRLTKLADILIKTIIIASMFAEGSPSGVKAYLSEMGLCKNSFRLPVWKVSEKQMQKIRELMKAVDPVNV